MRPIDQAATDMALAKEPEHYETMAKVYDQLPAENGELEKGLHKIPRKLKTNQPLKMKSNEHLQPPSGLRMPN